MSRAARFALLLALNAAAMFFLLREGPRFLQQCFPFRELQTTDFVQDWTSARNVREGLPVYWPLRDGLHHHLHLSYWFLHLHYNAHPPTSVFFFLPLGWLEYTTALLVWNTLSLLGIVISLILAGRTWGWRWPVLWWMPGLALAVLFNPLSQQMMQGQMNGVLLLLLTLCWRADRDHRPGLAGTCLALAMALKLYPGFLLLHFAVQGRWRLIVTTVGVFGCIVLLSYCSLGQPTFVDYVQVVLPDVQKFRCHFANASLNGFWHKLLVGQPDAKVNVEPLFYAPWAAKLAWAASWLLVAACSIFYSWKARTESQRDLTFGLNLTAMLLLSPVTWEHTLVILLPWVIQLWRVLPKRVIPRTLWVMLFISIGFDHIQWWKDRFAAQWPLPLEPKGYVLQQMVLLQSGGGVSSLLPGYGGPAGPMLALEIPPHFTWEIDLLARGWDVLGWMAVPFYTLLGWFILQCWVGAVSSREECLSVPSLG